MRLILKKNYFRWHEIKAKTSLILVYALFTTTLHGQTNPIDAAGGFLLLVEGDAQLVSNETDGGVAIGGDLILANHLAYNGTLSTTAYRVDLLAASNYMYNSNVVSLLVQGNVQYLSGNSLSIPPLGRTMLLGDCTGTSILNPSVNSTQLTDGVNTLPVLNIAALQTTSDLCVPSPFNFDAAFTEIRALNTCMSQVPSNIEFTDQNGNTIADQNNPPLTTTVHLVPNQENVLSTTFSALNMIQNLTFTSNPTANQPLIVNVDGGGASNVYWTLSTLNLSASHAPYVVWNITNVDNLYILGSQSLEGSLYAPDTKVFDEGAGNIQGTVIVKEFVHSGGEIHDYKFSTTLSCEYTPCTPTLSVTDTEICQGVAINLYDQQSSAQGTLSYSTNGTTWAALNDPTTISPPATAAYYIRDELSSDCEYIDTLTINVSVPHTISISGGTSICTGGTATLTASPSGGAGSCAILWQWSPNGFSNWMNISGATSTSYTTPSLTTNTFYRARYNCSGSPCPNAFSNTQQINVTSDPSVFITGGDVTVCSGGSVLLTAIVGGGTGTISFQWQNSSDGTTFTNISGATGQTYNTGGLSQTTHYQVLISFTGNGCETATSTIAQITIVDDPSVSISGEITICTGGSITLNANESGGTGTCSMQWQYNNGGTWLNLSGAVGTTYTTPNLTATTRYRVRYNCSGGGCNLASSTHEVIVLPDPVISISLSADEICVGGNVTINATPSGGLGTCTIQWYSRESGGIWTNILGATGTSYTTPSLSSGLSYTAAYQCDGVGCCE